MQAHLLSQAPFRSDAVEVTDEQHLENDDRVDQKLSAGPRECNRKDVVPRPDLGELSLQ